MADPTTRIPEPYQAAYDQLRNFTAGHGIDRIQHFVHEGMGVHYYTEQGITENIGQRTVQRVHLTMDALVNRLRGILPRPEIDEMERIGPYCGRNLTAGLSPEYRAAYERVLAMARDLPRGQINGELRYAAAVGIPVPDPFAPNIDPASMPAMMPRGYGTVTVYPVQVFRAMFSLRMREIHGNLTEFAMELLRGDPVWNCADGARSRPAPWRGATYRRPLLHAENSVIAESIQRAYNEMINLRLDHDRMVGFDNAWDALSTFNPHFRAEESEKYRAERAAAEKKAVALLQRVVTPEEFESYEKNKYIEVVTDNFIYHVKLAGMTSLFTKDWKTHVKEACLQLVDNAAPAQDRMVMEYLMLKNDEPRYLKTANLFDASPVSCAATYVGHFGNLGNHLAYNNLA